MINDEEISKMFRCKVVSIGKVSKAAILRKTMCEHNKIEKGDEIIFILKGVEKKKKKKGGEKNA